MSDSLKRYFEALERLKSGKPIHLKRGSRITNDSVSLEAGRKKGSIKRSRPVFSELIQAIEAASKVESASKDNFQVRLDEAKSNAALYRALWEESLAREVSLFKQLWDEREAWAKEREAITCGKVTPITGRQAG